MTLAFSSFVFLLGIGTPVAFAIGCTAIVTLVFTTDVPIALIAHQFFGGMDKFPIMAIPFFVLAGVIMESGGLSQRVIDFSSALVGWITGSLLMVSVVAATGLAAMSGSGSADVAAISAIMQPELKKRKYDIDFSAALISTAGTLAQIIPPSIMMVLMAVVNDLSVGPCSWRAWCQASSPCPGYSSLPTCTPSAAGSNTGRCNRSIWPIWAGPSCMPFLPSA